MHAGICWADIALRLAAALLAGGTMIEANLMLDVTGKTQSSFTMMDALRFPLAIVSGVGFIGAQAPSSRCPESRPFPGTPSGRATSPNRRRGRFC